MKTCFEVTVNDVETMKVHECLGHLSHHFKYNVFLNLDLPLLFFIFQFCSLDVRGNVLLHLFVDLFKSSDYPCLALSVEL